MAAVPLVGVETSAMLSVSLSGSLSLSRHGYRQAVPTVVVAGSSTANGGSFVALVFTVDGELSDAPSFTISCEV